MLSKKICRKCYQSFPSDDRWNYSEWLLTDERDWNALKVVNCPPFGDSVYTAHVDQPPRNHCPFALEHYLSKEEGD